MQSPQGKNRVGKDALLASLEVPDRLMRFAAQGNAHQPGRLLKAGRIITENLTRERRMTAT
jgi:hypothetical protein